MNEPDMLYTTRFFDSACPDPAAFFENAREFSCAFFWKGREDDALWMGYGCAASLYSIEECRYALALFKHNHAPFAPRAFCAVPFDRAFSPVAPWESFPARIFVIPLILIRAQNGQAAVLMLNKAEMSVEIERRLRNDLSRRFDSSPAAFVRISPQTQRGEWRRRVENALREMMSGLLRKVVVARTGCAYADQPILAAAVLEELLKQDGCSVFAIRWGNDVFLGASPERLFALNGRELITESLAGTCARGRTEREDRKFANALLESEKEQREHEIVRSYIAERLQKLCSEHQSDKPAVRKLSTVQHLYTTLRGTLLPQTELDHILEALHPTPAVCGDPRDKARELIGTLEATPRGYYTGSLGWVDADRAEMAVAIRCGLIKHKRAVIFAGAGIVPGSDPDAEWLETENKMQSFLQALGVAE